MIEQLEIFQYPFMQRAVIAGIMLAGVLALLGVFVLLRRMSFFADGIAHASLAGVAIGIVLSLQPLLVALGLSVVFALVIYGIERRFAIASDTVIGILFTSGMAFGVLLISQAPGYQPELISFLFGNILGIQSNDLWLIGVLSLAIVGFVAYYFRKLTLLSLDEELAYVANVKTRFLQPALYVILAVAVVLGIKILGVVLVSALLILPTAAARVIAPSFRTFIILSLIFGEAIVVIGIVLSAVFDLPTGPLIVLVGTGLFSLALARNAVLKRA